MRPRLPLSCMAVSIHVRWGRPKTWLMRMYNSCLAYLNLLKLSIKYSTSLLIGYVDEVCLFVAAFSCSQTLSQCSCAARTS